MKKLVNFIISSLVDNKDDFSVAEIKEDSDFTRLLVKAHPDDLGKIIGKKGRIIKAIREIMKIKAVKSKKPSLLILEEPLKK